MLGAEEHMSLRSRLLFAMGVMILFIVGGISSVVYFRQERLLTNLTLEKFFHITQSYRNISAEAVISFNWGRLETAVIQRRNINHYLDDRENDTYFIQHSPLLRPVKRTLEGVEGETVFDVFQYLHRQGREVGCLRIGFSRRLLKQELTGTLYTTIGMGLFFLLLSYVLIFLVAKEIVKPLHYFTEEVSKVSSAKDGIELGDRLRRTSHSENVTTTREVQALQDSFVQMSQNLRMSFDKIERQNEDMLRQNKAFVRFVPREFLRFLEIESIVDVKLGDAVQKEMSILFTDIRSFTSLSESMTPQENFNFINGYLGRVGPVIRSRGGFIDKYIGDAVMALFPERPEDAIDAAIELQCTVELYNRHRNNSGYDPISIGIGIHTGSIMLGMIGEAERMEGTVISDAVNMASRLEGMTKEYGACQGQEGAGQHIRNH